MAQQRVFDLDKSTDVRFRKLKSLVDAFEIYQMESYNVESKEWVVKTRLVVYKHGFKKESTGMGSMSSADEAYGWCALPYASTTSLGRAISLLGILEDGIATELEVKVSEDKRPAPDFVKPTQEVIREAVAISEENDFESKKVSKVINKPEKLAVKYNRLQIMRMPIEQSLTIIDEIVSKEYKIKVSDLPVDHSKQNIYLCFKALYDGKFMELAHHYVNGAINRNIEEGFPADTGIPAYIIEHFGFHTKPGTSINDSKVEIILERFLSSGKRDHETFLREVLEPLDDDGYTNAQLVDVFNIQVKNGMYKYENIGLMFMFGTVEHMRKFLTQVYSRKPIR